MNDAVFNTLLAVAQMCYGHFDSISTGTGDHWPPPVIVWSKGFEQCAEIQKAVEAETSRRAAAKSAEEHKQDLARLRNGLNAAHGKPFDPEPEPPPPKPYPWNGGCVIPTDSATFPVLRP